MSDSAAQDFKSKTTSELCELIHDALPIITDDTRRELMTEAYSRLRDYANLATGSLPGQGDTPHQTDIEKLGQAIGFFTWFSKVLRDLRLADPSKPPQEMETEMRQVIERMQHRASRFLAAIGEIYARGGVKFNYLVLSDEMMTVAEKALKETGQIPN